VEDKLKKMQFQYNTSSSSKEFTSGLWHSKVKIQSPTGYKLKLRPLINMI